MCPLSCRKLRMNSYSNIPLQPQHLDQVMSGGDVFGRSRIVGRESSENGHGESREIRRRGRSR